MSITSQTDYKRTLNTSSYITDITIFNTSSMSHCAVGQIIYKKNAKTRPTFKSDIHFSEMNNPKKVVGTNIRLYGKKE